MDKVTDLKNELLQKGWLSNLDESKSTLTITRGNSVITANQEYVTHKVGDHEASSATVSRYLRTMVRLNFLLDAVRRFADADDARDGFVQSEVTRMKWNERMIQKWLGSKPPLAQTTIVEAQRDIAKLIAAVRVAEDALNTIVVRSISAQKRLENREGPSFHDWDLSWWRGHTEGWDKAADVARGALAQLQSGEFREDIGSYAHEEIQKVLSSTSKETAVKRLEALERLYECSRRRTNAVHDIMADSVDTTLKGPSNARKREFDAHVEIVGILDELEAME